MSDDRKEHGVLVVDDEPLVLKYTTSVISGVGYKKVRQAATGRAAREVFEAEDISLIISDISLPDADGRQLIREALERHPSAAGVLITGYAVEDLRMPPDLNARVRFLEKPFTADDISHILAELVERRVEAVPAGRV